MVRHLLLMSSGGAESSQAKTRRWPGVDIFTAKNDIMCARTQQLAINWLGLVQHHFLLVLLLVLPLLLNPHAVLGVLSEAGGADEDGGAGEASDNTGGSVLVHGVGEDILGLLKVSAIDGGLALVGVLLDLLKVAAINGGLGLIGLVKDIDVQCIDVQGIDIHGVDVQDVDIQSIGIQGIDIQDIDVHDIDMQSIGIQDVDKRVIGLVLDRPELAVLKGDLGLHVVAVRGLLVDVLDDIWQQLVPVLGDVLQGLLELAGDDGLGQKGVHLQGILQGVIGGSLCNKGGHWQGLLEVAAGDGGHGHKGVPAGS